MGNLKSIDFERCTSGIELLRGRQRHDIAGF